MKPIKQSNSRWEKQKELSYRKKPCNKSSAQYFCGKCNLGFACISDWEGHPCGVWDVHSSE